MIGSNKLNSVMDVFLIDEIYYSLYSFIERSNEFFSTGKLMEYTFFSKDYGWGTTLTVNLNGMTMNKYRSTIIPLSMVDNDNSFLNTFNAECVIIQSNASSTDLCPYKSEHKDYEFGWYMRNHLIREEIECELFQESTVDDVYSLWEIQEIMNRARNLPLLENKTLTLNRDFRYPQYYSNLHQFL